jgi:hypothetical protein
MSDQLTRSRRSQRLGAGMAVTHFVAKNAAETRPQQSLRKLLRGAVRRIYVLGIMLLLATSTMGAQSALASTEAFRAVVADQQVGTGRQHLATAPTPDQLNCVRNALTLLYPNADVAWPQLVTCARGSIDTARPWLQQFCVNPFAGFSPGLRNELCRVHITGTSVRQEGVMLYLSVSFRDLPGFARGFGFRGIKGSGWAEESHVFDSPSYGRVHLQKDPLPGGRVEYPFNHGCGTPGVIETDVAFWIYNEAGAGGRTYVERHLRCAPGGVG